MKIGIDIDGVLADFTTDYIELLCEVSGVDRRPTSLYTTWQAPCWGFEEGLGFSKKDINTTWEVIKLSDDFWFNLAPLSPEINLHALANNDEVYFITTRVGKHVKHQTEQWLKEIHNVLNPTVLISADKGAVARGLELDVFIDDRDKNLWSVKGARKQTQCYVLDYPYNSGVDSTIATRIQQLSEIICDGHLVGGEC